MKIEQLFSVKGKTAIVTGVAQGLGKEIALSLAENGANLVLSDIQYPEETSEAVKATGADWMAAQTDITDEAQIKDMAQEAASKFGKVDILINNAGISQLNYIASQDLSREEWDMVVGINLTGSFLCCKHFGKGMITGGGGNIINIVTTSGITGVTRAPAYSSSKAGVILLTKSLALEWARYNIRVNAIAPHYLETPLTKGLRASEKVHNGLISKIPMRRFGKPSEMVGAVIFLASEASSYVTGSVIVADGGYLAQ